MLDFSRNGTRNWVMAMRPFGKPLHNHVRNGGDDQYAWLIRSSPDIGSMLVGYMPVQLDVALDLMPHNVDDGIVKATPPRLLTISNTFIGQNVCNFWRASDLIAVGF